MIRHVGSFGICAVLDLDLGNHFAGQTVDEGNGERHYLESCVKHNVLGRHCFGNIPTAEGISFGSGICRRSNRCTHLIGLSGELFTVDGVGDGVRADMRIEYRGIGRIAGNGGKLGSPPLE